MCTNKNEYLESYCSATANQSLDKHFIWEYIKFLLIFSLQLEIKTRVIQSWNRLEALQIL